MTLKTIKAGRICRIGLRVATACSHVRNVPTVFIAYDLPFEHFETTVL
ncbi:MAG: hypothetical protein R8F89_09485 [Roseobacter sp.]|nr:hypothetical protein [Roseobacter sp.]